MNLPLALAKRYLISKKSHNAINLISLISVCGVAVITMAMVCTLSVFNGFQNMVASFFSSLDPELRIEAAKGKTFLITDPDIKKIESLAQIDVFTQVLEETVLLKYGDRQLPAIMKSVSNNFNKLTSIDSIIVGGQFILKDSVVSYAILGIGLSNQLGVKAGFLRPIDVFIPHNKGKVNLLRPEDAFSSGLLFAGGEFVVNQAKYDDNLFIAPIEFGRSLLGENDIVSAIELKLKPGSNIDKAEKEIQSILGDKFIVLNRMEQQADSFRIMQLEKLFSYIMLVFILLIASFNVIGSLSMLIIDKKQDIVTLKNIGASDTFIRHIFHLEGFLISLSGAVVGLIIGVALCVIQQKFGVIKLGNDVGMFVTDAYPVAVEWKDILWVTLAVSVLGLLAPIYPVRVLSNRK
ncbi:MAG: ABC transporter permease [Bacteroidales bacterium]|nr:ABC transporter permease [Bacteroidales bacterium]